MDVIVPKVGLTVESVEILEWRKQLGDSVQPGEVVAHVSADKADLEIEAPDAGVIVAILVPVGATAAPGEAIARLGTGLDGEDPDGGRPAPVATAAAGAPSRTDGHVEPKPEPSRGRHRDGPLRASPLARRIAANRGLSLERLKGSGPRGRIVRADVERALSPSAPARAVASPPTAAAGDAPHGAVDPRAAVGLDAERVRWTAARRVTARLMEESARTAAPVTLHRRAAAERALAAVQRLKQRGVPATFTTAVLWAVAGALAEHPSLNAIWRDEDLLRARRIHLGLAIDADDELLSATIEDADRLDVIALGTQAAEAIARARIRQRYDGAPATFSVSNLGMFGIEQFTPIITPPQVAVLGVGAVVDGRCHLSLTFDHRAVDGAPAARFLSTVADRIAGFDGR